MTAKLFYDTCALLNAQEKAFKAKFVISQKTLEEIEHIKVSSTKDQETKYKARNCARLLKEHYGDYDVIPITDEVLKRIVQFKLEESPDTIILATAMNYKMYKNKDMIFVTDDINCYCLAQSVFGLTVGSIEDLLTDEGQYRGYIEKQLNEEEMADFYEHPKENPYGLIVNQYLIIKDDNGTVVDKLKWNGILYEPIKNVPFKSQMFGTLKPLDEIQACAMDSIKNNEITVLYGRAGSGKTTLPLNFVMQAMDKGKISKCYFVYSYEPLRGARTLGYEKGNHVTKLLQSASIGNILASKFGDIDQVEYMVDRGLIDIIPTANIRGVEFESNSCVICTESQNLDVYTIKTIIQRCKQGCKQIYEGDIIEQKDANIQFQGMNRLIDVFKGHPSFGCIKLKNNYRGELTELADKL